MKNVKKAVFVILCAVMLCALLCACGGASVRDDVTVADLSASLAAAIGQSEQLMEVDSNYIKGYMRVDPAQFAGYSMMINAYGTNIDEIGVFKAGEAMSAEEIKATVEAYLQLRLDSWMDEYMPEEKPKLTSAEVKVLGNYVCYCILSDADKATVFETFESALAQ